MNNKTTKSMRNFTFMKTSFKNLLLVLFFALLSLNVFAEGTPTVAPNAANITALLSAPDLNSGPYFNAPEDNRVKFTITNNVTQNLYFGFDWRQYAVGSPPRLTDIYWRIRRSSDLAVVVGPTLWDSALGSVGSIDTHAQALAGPNIAGSVPTGYNPIIFDPTQDGEYFIEIYRSSDGGLTARTTNADRAVGALFDLTVANNFAPYTKFNGRVNSDKWGFVAVSATYGNLVTANAEPVLFGYTNDQTIVRLDFETGFQPIAFNVALNSYGTTNVGSWLTTRRSRNDAVAPGLNNGYRVFLNVPDATLYPVGAIPTNPTFLSPAVTGCGPYLINYNVAEAGDVKLLLDLNGVPGFQNSTADRILEALDVLAGNNTISWDGLNGLGVAVPSGTNLNLALTFLKGRFNLPLYDAELNRNGIRIGIIAPIPIANAQMFWDDSALTNVGADCTLQTNNQTGTGINNSILGTTSPAHAWSGDGNLAQTIPAPNVAGNDTDGNQCTDFGNVRTINTWGWGYTSAATNLNIVLGCANLGVNKTVSNAIPLVGSNVTFTITASNAGPTQSPNTIVNDLLSASCYTFVSATPSVGTYNSATGVWSIGTLASGANATLSIVATVISQTGCGNTATITGDQEDPTPANNTSTVTPTPVLDTDGDGVADLNDLDDDNDGVLDTVENNCAPSSLAINTPNYPINTDFSGTSPLTGLGVYSVANFNFAYALQGTATWGTGIRLLNTGGLLPDGIHLNVQANNTNFTNGNTADYTLNFNTPVTNLSFKWGGMDNSDVTSFEAFNGGIPVPVVATNITNLNIPAANFTYLSPNTVVSTNGGANAPSNSVRFSIAGPVDRIVLKSGKNGTGAASVTLQLYELTYCLPLDTDNDGIPNSLDLDSDNDGCSDANEYYNSASADGNDNATYGVGTPAVNSDGTVTAASYTGSYANAINNSVTTACTIDAVNDP